jgi:hypothetical protein
MDHPGKPPKAKLTDRNSTPKFSMFEDAMLKSFQDPNTSEALRKEVACKDS